MRKPLTISSKASSMTLSRRELGNTSCWLLVLALAAQVAAEEATPRKGRSDDSFTLVVIQRENDNETEKAPPRKTWSYEELAPAVKQLAGGRSYERGRQLYKKIKCIACHRMDGDGNEFGPDLSRLDKKWTADRILLHIVEPSREINKDFEAHHFQLNDGRTLIGLIVAAGPNFIKVVDQPLKSSSSKRIRFDDISERHRSRVSFMPKGMLDDLQRDEVLDLIAYVTSRGNDQHAFFK